MSFYFQSICKKTNILFHFKLKFSPFAIIIMPDFAEIYIFGKIVGALRWPQESNASKDLSWNSPMFKFTVKYFCVLKLGEFHL